MIKQFNKQDIINNKGCYSLEQVERLSFINKEKINILDIINSEISLKDRFWFVRNKTNLTLSSKKQLALILAEVVLGIYNEKYPNDNRVSNCIQGIKNFNNNLISKEELYIIKNNCWSARNDAAANAVIAAADAVIADAADAVIADAADAADAAAAAADAVIADAADAADAAATYADAAAAAAADAADAAATYADADVIADAAADAANKIFLATKILNTLKINKKEKTYNEKLKDALIIFINNLKED
jgi:hypothetical protein